MKPIYILGIIALLAFTSSIASAYTEVPVNFYKYDSNDPDPQPILYFDVSS